MKNLPKWAYIKKWETKVTPKYSMITFSYDDAQIVEILSWLWDRFDGNPTRDTYLVRIGEYEHHHEWAAPETMHKDPKIYFKNPKDLTFFILSCTK
jgi:hypothetical protein